MREKISYNISYMLHISWMDFGVYINYKYAYKLGANYRL
jgi:hypothetical protein